MSRKPRAYTSVLAWLESELRAGRIRIGDKLPGERVLAEKFQISRASVREATRILDAMGLVRSSVGSGPRSGAIVISEPSEALAWALRMHVATKALPVSDVVDTRLLLETQAALTAADKTRCPDTAERMEVLARARELLEQMDDPELPADDFHALDAQFHILLSSLSGNVVLETMMTSIREATIGYVQETVAKLHIWSDVSRTLQAHHWKILEAVQRRDGERACQLLREHITWFSGLGARGAR